MTCPCSTCSLLFLTAGSARLVATSCCLPPASGSAGPWPQAAACPGSNLSLLSTSGRLLSVWDTGLLLLDSDRLLSFCTCFSRSLAAAVLLAAALPWWLCPVVLEAAAGAAWSQAAVPLSAEAGRSLAFAGMPPARRCLLPAAKRSSRLTGGCARHVPNAEVRCTPPVWPLHLHASLAVALCA